MNALWAGMVTHLWQTTLVLALIALLAMALRRAPARYVEGLWTVALLKLLVPLPLLVWLWPALKLLGASFRQQETIGPAVERLSQIAYPEMLWVAPLAEPAGALAPTASLVATTVWALGCGALLALWWRRARVAAPAGEEPWHANEDILTRVERAARATGVPLNRIRITDDAVVPCVGSLRRPTVVLPRAVVQTLRDDELRAVLAHEEAHRRRGDLWRGVLQRITTSVFYFYPPAWWLVRRLRASAEMACDEAVLATGIDARTYARALARTVVLDLQAPPVPALASGRSPLSARLQRIQSPERYAAMKRHRLAVAAAVVAAVALSFLPVADGSGLPFVANITEGNILENPQLPGEWLPADRISGLNGLESQVELHFVDRPLAEVFMALGEANGFTVWFMSSADFTRRVSVAVSGETLRDALGLLAASAGIEYNVVDADTLIVRVVPGEPMSAEQVLEGDVRTSDEMRAVVRRTPAEVRRIPEEEIRQATVQTLVPGPYRVGGDIKEPERIHYVSPEYPELARRARMEGFVILQAVIDTAGNVKDVEVLRGLGLGLDEAASDAVRQWRYTPTVYEGEPVEVILTVNVAFQLIQ